MNKKIVSTRGNIIKIFFVLLLCSLLLLLWVRAKSHTTIKFKTKMELTQDYDDSDPFIDERLFYLTDSIDSLTLDISLQLEGESGVLEIEDNKTKQVLWKDNWKENIENATVTASLDSPQKDREYVIRFTGTKIKHAKIVITSNNNLIKERTKPVSTEMD